MDRGYRGSGIISTTGIAGLTLGGGIGYLTRGCGLSADNLVSADVVTADGQMVVPSENQNADLFWAIRGGGGNTVSSTMHLYPINGVCHDIAPDATAFGHRDANFSRVVISAWEDPADDGANVQWVRDYSAAIAPHSEAGGYINFMDGDDANRIQANYGNNYPRLVDV